MERARRSRNVFFFATGGCLLPSLFLYSSACADTVVLKTGKDLKGLVVEEHEDRIILSTENGELTVLRRGIKSIDYDDPGQNFLQIARAYEEKKRYGEALAYYEKALETNPSLEEARSAMIRVRNLFWAKAATGPVEEVARRQELYENWSKPGALEKKMSSKSDPGEWLEKSMGLKLEKKADWVRVSQVAIKKEAWNAGLRRGDRLVTLDGASLRYLGVDAVRDKMISPRGTSFGLEYDRECRITKTGFEKDIKEFGITVKMGEQGVEVTRVKEDSEASRAGMKVEDRLVEVGGHSLRYVPIKKIMMIVQQDPSATQSIFVVRRSTFLTRR